MRTCALRSISLGALAALLLLAGSGPARADEAAEAQEAVAAIQSDINTAIDRGVLRLLKQQQRDGSWGDHEVRYGGGMTGLALYALIRSGLPLEHPAIRRGLARLLTWDPEATYSIACELMALEATHDKRYRPRMQMLLERLLARQRDGWGYPFQHAGAGWSDRRSRNDLSNTHFAALALRVARLAGLEVPAHVFKDLIKEARFHQHRPKDSVRRGPDGRPVQVAGFAYVGPSTTGGIGKPTGSMTCAGITILQICRDALGDRLWGKKAAQVETSIAQGLAWLDTRWQVEANPNQANRKYYYLYGLERVGSLLETDRIGSHFWYLEGAREFLKTQTDRGGWGSEPETAYALLFLMRATAPSTGTPPLPSVLGRYETERKSPIRIRAAGHSPLETWVASVDTGTFSGRAIERFAWLVDGEVWTTVPVDPPRPWANDTFRVLHHVRFLGDFTVQMRIHLAATESEAARVVDSAPLSVKVEVIWPPWGLREAGWASRNLLAQGAVTATASSFNNSGQAAPNSVDGTTDGFWVCRKDDPRPTLELELRRGVKANAVVLHPVAGHELQRNTFDRPTRVEIRVNGGRAVHVVRADPDDLRPVALHLPKPVRIKKLEIAIVERLPGSSWTGQAGFAEVSLELDPVLPPTWTRSVDGLVTLACESPEAAIHYTVDGTVPTAASLRYETPFPMTGAGRLHAVAWLPSGEISRLLTADVPVADGYLRVDRAPWRILHTDSEVKPGNAGFVLDGNPATHWHTSFGPETDPYPHELQIDLGETLTLAGFTYRARRKGTNGNVKDWTVYVSDAPEAWGEPVAEGQFENVRALQRALFAEPVAGRYLRFVARSEQSGQAFASCAELDVLVSGEPGVR